MLSLQKHFSAIKAEREAKSVEKAALVTPDINFAHILKTNVEWNQRIAEIREARQAKERTNEEARILEDIERREAEREEQRRRTNELVLKEKVKFSEIKSPIVAACVRIYNFNQIILTISTISRKRQNHSSLEKTLTRPSNVL